MKELNLARDEVLKYIRSVGVDQNQSHSAAEWKGNTEYTGGTQEYQTEDNYYYFEWQYGDDNSFNLWLNRGRCSENVWMWSIIPFLLPYAYYKVGNGWKGVGILLASPIIGILFAILIGVGAVGIAMLVYGLFDTYNIAKEYNRVYAEGYKES